VSLAANQALSSSTELALAKAKSLPLDRKGWPGEFPDQFRAKRGGLLRVEQRPLAPPPPAREVAISQVHGHPLDLF